MSHIAEFAIVRPRLAADVQRTRDFVAAFGRKAITNRKETSA